MPMGKGRHAFPHDALRPRSWQTLDCHALDKHRHTQHAHPSTHAYVTREASLLRLGAWMNAGMYVSMPVTSRGMGSS